MRTISSTGPTSIENHWSTVKNVFISGAERMVGRVQGRNNTWLSEETWAKIDEIKQMKACLAVAHGEERNEIESIYRIKMKKVQRLVRRDKRNHNNVFALEAEEAVSKELAGVQSSKQHPVKGTDGVLLISDEERLRMWKEHFAQVLNHVFESNN